MNMPIPPIHETPAELPRRLNAERDAQTQPRLHALSLTDPAGPHSSPGKPPLLAKARQQALRAR
jgi:hypothetical protein